MIATWTVARSANRGNRRTFFISHSFFLLAKERMGEEFEYMVTPLVFDLELNLKSADYEIAKVYGSDTANKENGNIMKVNSLFPSKTTSNGEVKGGVILLKLNKKNEKTSGNLNLSVSYKDRDGKEFSNSKDVIMAEQNEHYDNTGIRKAIVLTRYANGNFTILPPFYHLNIC